MAASWTVAPGGEAWSTTWHGSQDERAGTTWLDNYQDFVGNGDISCSRNRYWLTAQ